MTGEELRRLLREQGLSQKALGQALGLSQSAIGQMLQREHVGRVNATAIRYVLDNGPEPQILEAGEVLRVWRSQKQLAWYSGISLSTIYRVLSGQSPITPRLSMAMRQAQIDRTKRREETEQILAPQTGNAGERVATHHRHSEAQRSARA